MARPRRIGPRALGLIGLGLQRPACTHRFYGRGELLGARCGHARLPRRLDARDVFVLLGALAARGLGLTCHGPSMALFAMIWRQSRVTDAAWATLRPTTPTGARIQAPSLRNGEIPPRRSQNWPWPLPD